MPDPEAIVSVVREWIIKSENDLKTAAHTLKLGKDAPTDTVCFMPSNVSRNTSRRCSSLGRYHFQGHITFMC